MKVTLENTDKLVDLVIPDGGTIPARIWEGTTDTGIRVHAYITRIAVAVEDDQEQFVRELKECRAPSAAVEAIPLRLIL